MSPPPTPRNPRRIFRTLARRLLKVLAGLALLVLLGLAALFAILWRDHKTEITLPQPTGTFAVGRTTYTWVNHAETDELSPTPGAKRQVLVWIWYPAAPTTSAPPVEYFPAAWQRAEAQSSGVLMSKFLTRDLSLVHAHSTSRPDLSPAQRSYPVVILRAGGAAYTTDYTTLAEDLASHGYIVVGFDAPYRTFAVVLPDQRVVTRPPANDPENLSPDQASLLINRLLPMWTSDTRFVVNQLQKLNAGGLSGDSTGDLSADPTRRFAGRLDLQRLGMFGHSFGGATALQFCHDDPRCKAGIDIDGAPYGSVVQEGLQQPFMFILSDHSHDLPDPAGPQIRANFQSLFDRLPNGRLFLTIRGANHFSFSDQMLVKSHFIITLLHTFGFGSLEGRRGLAITAAYVHTFFDVYLKGAPPASLTQLSQSNPEVQSGQQP